MKTHKCSSVEYILKWKAGYCRCSWRVGHIYKRVAVKVDQKCILGNYSLKLNY